MFVTLNLQFSAECDAYYYGAIKHKKRNGQRGIKILTI